MADEACMLTTFDNPYNPFTQFDNWFHFDTEKGYNTCDYLGRIAKTSDEFTDEEYSKAIEAAIDEIIKYDFMNIYKKYTKTTKNKWQLQAKDIGRGSQKHTPSLHRRAP